MVQRAMGEDEESKRLKEPLLSREESVADEESARLPYEEEASQIPGAGADIKATAGKIQTHEDYWTYVQEGRLIVKNFLQLLEQKQFKGDTLKFCLRTLSSALIITGGMVKDETETRQEVQKERGPNDLLLLQDALHQLGTTDMLISLVSKEVSLDDEALIDYEVINEILKFAIALTCYGEKKTQEPIMNRYKYWAGKHCTQMFFLQNLCEVIEHANLALQVPYVDVQVYRMTGLVLKFLKNLCEQHNLDWQNILRQQEGLKLNVPLLEELSALFLICGERMSTYQVYLDKHNARPLLESMSTIKGEETEDRFLNMQLLDWFGVDQPPSSYDFKLFQQACKTLTELLQGPCELNQRHLVKLRTAQDARDMLKYLNAINFMGKVKADTGEFVYEGHRKQAMYEYFQLDDAYKKAYQTSTKRAVFLSSYQREILDKTECETKKQALVLELNFLEYLYAMIEGVSEQNDEIFDYLSKALDEEKMIQYLEQHLELADYINDEKLKPSAEKAVKKVEPQQQLGEPIGPEGGETALLRKDFQAEEESKVAEKQARRQAKEDLTYYQKEYDTHSSLIYYYIALMTAVSENIDQNSPFAQTWNAWISNKDDEMEKLKKEDKYDKDKDPREYVCRIEVVDDDQKLCLMYFPKPKQIRDHWDNPYIQNNMEVLKAGIDRDSAESKLQGFDAMSQHLMRLVEHLGFLQSMKLEHKYAVFVYATVIHGKNIIKYIMFGLVVALNIIMLSYVDQSVLKDGPSDGFNLLFILLGIPLLVLSMMYLANHVIMDTVPTIRDLLDPIEEPPNIFKVQAQALDPAEEKLFTKNKPKENKIKAWFQEHLGEKFDTWKEYFSSVVSLHLFYKLAMVIIVGWATFIHYPVIALAFIMIMFEDQTMRALLRVCFNFDTLRKLIACVLMSIIFFYWYTTWSFWLQYFEHYSFGKTMSCGDLQKCLRSHFDGGWVNPPEFEKPDVGGDPHSWDIYVFNFSYILLINMITTAIISGVIIDAFGEMRDHDEQKAEDDDLKCMICDMPRDDFDKLGLSFASHREEEHNINRYIWLKVYLKDKQNLEMNGLESYIWKLMVSKNVTSFMPMYQSLSMNRKIEELEFDEQKKMINSAKDELQELQGQEEVEEEEDKQQEF